MRTAQDDQGAAADQTTSGRPATQNRLLMAMPAESRAWLEPLLTRVTLVSGDVLAEAEQSLSRVYFPETCVISLVNHTGDGEAVEIGTIGNEGFVGLGTYLDAGAIPAQQLVQVAGDALHMDAKSFSAAVDGRPELRQVFNRYAHAFVVQVSQTAACNGMHDIEQRCARWLLMTHDRVGGNDGFDLTHEFLAFMLGVRRAGVTQAAGALQRRALIRYSRGHITIVDREGLEAASCPCYAIVRRHFERLLGMSA